MHNPLNATLDPGTVLLGKYRIERVLGQGGMGIVAAAYHIQLEQRVALKLMLPHALGSPEAIGRFLREARAAARITSEHVARVYDVGALESGEPYIAMEYLEGLDVGQLLAQRGSLPYTEAVDYLLQACEALAEAHAAGIVHRDLKPANLYLAHRVDGQRLIKVLDFGISKMSGASQSDAPATRTSALMGSPLYMSPEQMGSSRNVDARSDVWALGVILYEMLCGKPPFDGETLPQVCAMVMTEAPLPLSERARDLPAVLYQVVQRCLEKQPAARFQSVAELAHALEPIASARAQQSVERISRVLGVTSSGLGLGQVPSAAVTGPRGTQASWGETNPRQVTPRKPPIALFATLGLLALAGTAVGLRFALGGSAPPISTQADSAQAATAPPTASAVPAQLVAPAAAPAVEAPVAASAAPAAPTVDTPVKPALAKPAALVAPKSKASKPAAAAAPAKPAPAKPAPAPVLQAPPASTVRSRL